MKRIRPLNFDGEIGLVANLRGELGGIHAVENDIGIRDKARGKFPSRNSPSIYAQRDLARAQIVEIEDIIEISAGEAEHFQIIRSKSQGQL